MERSYTYEKPTDLFDPSSAMETVSCKYVGPEEILIVVDIDGKFSIEEIPQFVDGVWTVIDKTDLPEDMNIPETDDRYVLLDANNDNHVPLMQMIAGQEITLKDEIVVETIGTYTHADGSTFVLKCEDPNDSMDPTSVIDAETTIISSDNTVNYTYTFKSISNDVLIEAVDSNIHTATERKMAAETAALKTLWAKHIAILNWIKDDIIGSVDPAKIVIPNVVDVELGASFAEMDI